MDPVTEAPRALTQEIIEGLPIIVGEEDILLGVAAQNYMIKAAWHFQTWFTSHRLSSRHQSSWANNATIHA